jgi:aspartate aminotransferase-like enzyme
VITLVSSGTGGMESAVSNFLSPGDKALVINGGKFGERWLKLCQVYGAKVEEIKVEWGYAVDPQKVSQALKKDPAIKAVYVQASESSTGVAHDVKTLSQIMKPLEETILVVDAVSAMGVFDLPTDAWGLDVVVTGSQKGWMVPPGLAFVSMSERAWRAYEHARMPRFYFDLGRHRDALAKGQTPWTPTMSIFFGLDVALERRVDEGAERIFARHASIARMVRGGVKEMGLDLLCEDERFASDTVTAVKAPEGVDVGKLRTLMEDEHDVVLAGGQGKLQGKIFRIGHLGLVEEEDIRDTLQSLEAALPKLGYKLPAVR